MDRLRDYSLLQLMTVASRSAAYAGPERRSQDRQALPGDVSAVCARRAGLEHAMPPTVDHPRLRPVTVADGPLGRPLVLPYVASDWPLTGPGALGVVMGPASQPDFSSTVILPNGPNPAGTP